MTRPSALSLPSMHMPLLPIRPLAHRRVTVAALLAGCLLLVGCVGSSSHGGTTTSSFPGGIRPIGPAKLSTNLIGLMSKGQPYLKHVKATCPSGPITHFPVHCHFTALQVAPAAGSSKHFPGPYRVGGSLTALGVYFRTRTYEYELNYVPLH